MQSEAKGCAKPVMTSLASSVTFSRQNQESHISLPKLRFPSSSSVTRDGGGRNISSKRHTRSILRVKCVSSHADVNMKEYSKCRVGMFIGEICHL